jgi:hypothetical protein
MEGNALDTGKAGKVAQDTKESAESKENRLPDIKSSDKL